MKKLVTLIAAGWPNEDSCQEKRNFEYETAEVAIIFIAQVLLTYKANVHTHTEMGTFILVKGSTGVIFVVGDIFIWWKNRRIHVHLANVRLCAYVCAYISTFLPFHLLYIYFVKRRTQLKSETCNGEKHMYVHI